MVSSKLMRSVFLASRIDPLNVKRRLKEALVSRPSLPFGPRTWTGQLPPGVPPDLVNALVKIDGRPIA